MKQREKREWERVYGSVERVQWIRSLPCVGCGAKAKSHGHHVKSGGMGRKADHIWVVPLCFHCHRSLHNTGQKTWETQHNVDLELTAQLVASLWRGMCDERLDREVMLDGS